MLVRGVVQGDIVSPLLFILALDLLVKTYDKSGVGVSCGEKLTIRVLGYADDAALAEERIEEMTTRLTALADGSVQDADMTVRMDKTFSHHVGKQELQEVTAEEVLAAQADFEHQCDFCDRRFKTKSAMRIHRDSCPYNYGTTDEVFELEKIVGVFGRINQRWFLVKPTTPMDGDPVPSMVTGTCEAEYMALSLAVKELIWMHMLFRSMGVRVRRPCVVYEDNSAALKIANNATAIKRTKHIDVRHPESAL